MQPIAQLMTVEGELHAPSATARLVRFCFDEPVDRMMRSSDTYRVDMCLTPRPANARARYPERSGARGFEPLGKLFVVPPGENMQAASDGRCQQASVWCEFSPAHMQQWLDDDLSWSDEALLAGLDVRESNLLSLLRRLAQELKHPGFGSAAMVELIVGQLAIELARYGQHCGEKRAGGLSAQRMDLIEQRLRDGLAPPSLTELAELCGLSVRQLSRGFRASRGCSIGSYISTVRVERAQDLLAGGASVKAVALSLGFASASAFSFAFRRATGRTPSSYRSSCAAPVAARRDH